MITEKDYKEAVLNALNNFDGTTWLYVGEVLPRKKPLCLVFGWCEDDGEMNEECIADYYTQSKDERLYILRAKLAYNCDDLQCDYDMDWYEPTYEDGTVFGTDTDVRKDSCWADWKELATEAIRLLKKGILKYDA